MLLNFKPKSLIVLLLFSSSSLCFSAPIVDPNAPIQFRPDVLNLPNNVTVLGIPTPNASGISHMKFKEFSVYTNESLIWNNSVVSGNSILGGFLQGNANLFSSGPASTILNEVTWLGLPSQLDGKFEIFGQKANLIIANPNGISVNGAQFFNTSALNLIAGAPIVNGSQIKYNTTGNINIGSVGLDARDTEALNLIAQEINNRGSLRGPDLAPVPKAVAIVDLSTLQPDVAPGRIFVPVDAEGKVIKPLHSTIIRKPASGSLTSIIILIGLIKQAREERHISGLVAI
jgi:filamentous hemagglutinin